MWGFVGMVFFAYNCPMTEKKKRVEMTVYVPENEVDIFEKILSNIDIAVINHTLTRDKINNKVKKYVLRADKPLYFYRLGYEFREKLIYTFKEVHPRSNFTIS